MAEEPTLESATRRRQRALAADLQRTDLAYLTVERRTSRLVGSAGLHRTDWSVPRTEVGYGLRSSEVGKGYATEAVAERCGFELDSVPCNTMVKPDGSWSTSCVCARLPAAGKAPP